MTARESILLGLSQFMGASLGAVAAFPDLEEVAEALRRAEGAIESIQAQLPGLGEAVVPCEGLARACAEWRARLSSRASLMPADLQAAAAESFQWVQLLVGDGREEKTHHG